MARVFLSYPCQEENIATILAEGLAQAGLSLVLDVYDYDSGKPLLTHILYSVESSDFVLLLIPERSMEARWILKEINKIMRYKLKSRNISIVPIFIGHRPSPMSISEPVSFSIERGANGYPAQLSIERIISYLKNLPRVQFNHLSPRSFEELIILLLEKLRFFDVEHFHANDHGTDIQAKTRARNPFGGYGTISWVFDLKFHKDSRADITSLLKLSGYLEERPVGVNGVLITNGQLTSAAREWVELNQRSKRTSITIVDGTQLRELVLKYPDLIDRFFGSEVRYDNSK